MKRLTLFVVGLIILIVGLFTIEVETSPATSTRIIVEHTYKTYITPSCYEQAQKTNNISEVDLAKAQELNYKPESSCTEDSLKPIKQPIAYAIAEKLGLKQSKWTW
jgi:hypothetical protein